MQRKIQGWAGKDLSLLVKVWQCIRVSDDGELLGRTQSFPDTRTAGPSDETLSVPLEGTAQGHGVFI